MPKTYEISEHELKEIQEARKKNKDKKVEKRLQAVQLRGEGKKNREIAEKLDTVPDVVSQWVSQYKKNGIEGLMNHNKGGNRRLVSFEEEEKFLKQFTEKAENGEAVTIREIKAAYEQLIGHSTKSHGQIYSVLKRHHWRKIKPRPKHPKKASEEEINSSKKN